MATIQLTYPFAGRWLVQNSPADQVPSHGTSLFATSHSIDFVPVGETGRAHPMGFGSWFRPEAASRFPGFGRSVLSPIGGTVVAAHDLEPDHRAYRGFPSVGYALTQRRRAAAGWIALSGNYVFIETDGGAIVALCHLEQGSVVVHLGQRVRTGEELGRCGNSGNSTEPHLHLQAMDRIDAQHARSLPFLLDGALPRNGQIVHVPKRQ